MVELYLPEQVKSHHEENNNPERQIDFPVEDMPVIRLVGNAQEFKSERQFQEAQDDLHRIEPSAGFRKVFKPRRENSK